MLREIFEVIWETVRLLTFQPRNANVHDRQNFRKTHSQRSEFCE